MSDDCNYAVRKARYGRTPFDVIRIVKVTEKTHSYQERGYLGAWIAHARLERSTPSYPAMGLTEAQADALAEVANAAWVAAGDAIKEAEAALDAARAAREDAARAAISRATGATDA